MLASIRKRLEFNLMNDSASPSTKLVLAVALRCCVTLLVAGAVATATADETPAGKTLNGAEKFQQQEPDVGISANAGEEAGLLNQQLKSFGTWSAIEPVAATSPEVSHAKETPGGDADQTIDPSRPLMIPRLIDRPDGIDDQNVGPIPTQPYGTVEGSSQKAVTTTIPVVPNPDDLIAGPRIRNSAGDETSPLREEDVAPKVDVYESAPQLLVHADDSPAGSTTKPSDAQPGVWKLAAAQLVSTFLGVLLAVGLFLLIRVAAVKLFRANLGVTFQFGATSKPSAQTSSENEAADVVPFGTQTSPLEASSEQSIESDSGPVSAVAEPADFNFRVIGSDHGDDDSSSEGSGDLENEAGILKSVFEQNLHLLQELDKRKESAA